MNINLSADQVALIDKAYEEIRQSVYTGLVMQTRYRSILDLITLDVSESSISLNYSAMNQYFVDAVAQDPVNGMGDLLHFYQSNGAMLEGWNATFLIAELVRNVPVTPELESMYKSMGILMSAQAGGTLTGSSKNDLMVGGAGNDTLNGGSGADTLIGGVGTDTLNGGVGNDTYIFNKGDGYDVINDYDTAAGNIDTILFADVASTDAISVMRDGVHLRVRYGQDDRVTLGNYFSSSSYRIEEIKFSDGVTWKLADIAMRLEGTVNDDVFTGLSGVANGMRGLAGNDTLTGASLNDMLDGGEGDDTLNGEGGNDVLYGDVGIDTLNGGTGNDLLIGGNGNDTINTGAGNDIIAFNRGDGQDVVAASSGKDNALSLGGGIAYEEIALSKVSNDLIITTGSDEKITFKGWYSSSSNRSIANLQFIIEGSADYDQTSTSDMNNKKIQQFNFDGLVAAFDQARSATPSLTNWSMASALMDFHLHASDTEAIGGDFAYQYGKQGEIPAVVSASAQETLRSAEFGATRQTLITL